MISALALAAAAIWAIAALVFQAFASRWRGCAEFAPPTGNPGRGSFYSFTGAMRPSKKESVSHYPLSFGLGLVLHAGIFISLLAAPGTILFPQILLAGRVVVGIVAGLGLATCFVLLVRRMLRPELRAISPADDYGANLFVAVFLGTALALSSGWIEGDWFRWTAAVLLIYLPLGKLRHAVFFFLARADLGRRLGWRGVYPPARQGS